jgi:hypothetical protein
MGVYTGPDFKKQKNQKPDFSNFSVSSVSRSNGQDLAAQEAELMAAG